MPLPRPSRTLPALAALALVAAGCGGSSDEDAAGAGGAGGDRPTVVVTTSLLGDVVEGIVGDAAEVTVLLPPGSDPHSTQLSAREAAEVREADALVTNGGGLEEGMADALDAAEADGVPTFAALDAVEPLVVEDEGDDHAHGDEGDDHAHEGDDHAHEGDDHAHGDVGDDHAHGDEGGDHGHGDDGPGDEGEGGPPTPGAGPDGEAPAEDDPAAGAADGDDGDDGSGDEAAADDHDHDHGDEDPHFFTDPVRMAEAAEGIGAFLAEEVPGLDTPEVQERTAAEVTALEDLAEEVEETLAVVAPEDRKLVTNHDVFAPFAERFDFEVVGVVVPGGGTGAEPSAADLAELASTIEAAGVPAVFADVTAPDALVTALADEVGDVEVVALFTESLGDEGSGAETYPELVRTNAERIAAALG